MLAEHVERFEEHAGDGLELDPEVGRRLDALGLGPVDLDVEAARTVRSAPTLASSVNRARAASAVTASESAWETAGWALAGAASAARRTAPRARGNVIGGAGWRGSGYVALPPCSDVRPVPMPVRPKKRLGQHFLTDPNTVRRIVDALGAPPGGRVVEIGPGEGALTGALLQRYPGLVALEVDPEAVAHLRAQFPALDVRPGDVLDADWRALAEGQGAGGKGQEERPSARTASGPGPHSPIPHAPSPIPASGASLFVVGNLPYYITSPILFALLDARAHVARAVVMVQREVADRIVAPPGSKTYGTLSVYFALYAEARTLFTVSRHCFRPRPAVESAVVALDFGAAEPPGVAFGPLQRTVRAAFGQRRKMLRNSLGPVAEAAGVAVPEWAATLRPEAVSPADFVRLARHFADAG